MADKYPNFEELSRNERSGIDFGILLRQAHPAFAVVAPHGGGIEAGSSEIADAIAGVEHSFYAFEGLKESGNADLHITSTRFDEPLCLGLVSRSRVVVTIHGEAGEGSYVFPGGLDDEMGCRLRVALRAKGFDVRTHPDPNLQGREPTNLCNRGTTGRGVQLELSRGLRREMFLSLTREGRRQATPRLCEFAGAVRGVLSNTFRSAAASR